MAKSQSKTDELHKPPLTEESLLTLMGTTGKVITQDSRIEHFRPGQRTAKTMRKLLKHLKAQNLIEDNGAGQYKIATPWSDLAYATVTGDQDEYGNTFARIKNLPRSYPLKVTISKKQMKQHELKQGSAVLIQMGKGTHEFHMRAKILQVQSAKKPAHLTGKFKRAQNETHFEAGDKSIKGRFNLCAGSKADLLNNANCFAVLPLDYDIRQPCVFVSPDQDLVPGTGARISETLARKYAIDEPFSEASLDQSARLKYHHIPRESRIDLTGLKSFTVDPVDARDHDDMLFAERITGGWRSVTQITDVTELVHYNSALDQDAYKRGNTVYFPDKSYPMIPPDLTEKCSLLPNSDRPVLYAEMFHDEEGNLQDARLGFGVGRSHAKLSYGEYDDLVYQRDPLVKDLADLHDALRTKIHREPDQATSDTILNPDGAMFIGENTVETFMVQMNALIAKTLHEENIPTLFRNNGPTMDMHLYNATRLALQEMALELPENPIACDEHVIKSIFDEALSRGIQTPVRTLINTNLIDRAFYAPQPRGHFALKLKFYAHGTSPIRRYADLVVHRGLRTLKGMEHGLCDEQIKRIENTAQHLNQKKQQGKDLDQDLRRFHAIGDLKHLEGAVMVGKILQINMDNVEILMPRSGLRTRLTQDDLAGSGFRFDPKKPGLIYEGHGIRKRFEQDDKLHGQIGSVNPLEGRWRFKPVLIGDHHGPMPAPGL